MASSDTSCATASHFQRFRMERKAAHLLGGVADSFLVPAPRSAFEHFTCVDWRSPFKWAKNWKRKHRRIVKNERVLQAPSNDTRSSFRFAPSWMHRANRKKTNHGDLKVVSKSGSVPTAVEGKAKSAMPPRGRLKKKYFRSLVTIPWKRTNYTQTSTRKDADSLTGHSYRVIPGCSDFMDVQAINSCKHLYCRANTDCHSDDFEMNPPKPGRWGHWNDPDGPYVESQPNKNPHVRDEANRRGNGRFLKLKKLCWPFLRSRLVESRKRSKIMSLPVSDAAKELEALQLQQHCEEELNIEGLQLAQSTPEKACCKEEPTEKKASVKTSCDEEKGIAITFGCFSRKVVSHSHTRSLGMQNQLSHELDVKASTTREYEDWERSGTVEAASKIPRQVHPVDLEKVFSRFTSSDDPITAGTASYSTSDANDLTDTRTSLQVPNMPGTYNNIRSDDTPLAASSRSDDAGISSLNAKMDSRFEQVLKAIDIVADQVKKTAELQGQTTVEEEESVHSRLISSNTSELRSTLDVGFSPLRDSILHSQRFGASVIKEFKGALDDARFKMRVLAGLLTVEKDTKMAPARDLQCVKMNVTMGMIGAQMLEGEILLQKPWHVKYLLDYCVSSVFFKGPHGSSYCICSRPCSARTSYYPFRSYDSFCNDIEFSSMTFDSLCDDATVAVEELVGSRKKDWSEALTSMFWNCVVCCFHVHKLITAIHKGKGRVRILHPDCGRRFDGAAMDPLDTENFKAFLEKVHFTIFSGFMLESTVLARPQVYLEPIVPSVRL